jgi:hypothetical protein
VPVKEQPEPELEREDSDKIPGFKNIPDDSVGEKPS